MRGLVYKSTGSWYVVKDDSGRIWNARMKGVMKLDDITSTNPIAVGDRVELEEEGAGEGAMITAILHRHNQVNRQSPRARQHQHIVAANLDQSLLIATVRDPRTSSGFIDRFLVGCELYHVPAVVVFNKLDLHREADAALFNYYEELYSRIGYTVRGISIREGKGMEEVKALLNNKVTLISGHSGVGKSSFINAVIPEAGIRTKDVSGWSGKGQHTTTFAEMYDLPDGGQIIDTPGMREFGIVGVSKEELSGYFPEMRRRLNDCQFNNCQHINEPGCAIKDAVVSGAVSEDRYVSYVNILESMEERYR